MQAWHRLEQRYARLIRRERGILLAGGLIVVFLLGYSMVDASWSKQRVLLKQIDQARAATAASLAQTQTIIRQLAEDPDARARAVIAKLQDEARELDAQMQGVNRGLVPPQQMASILEKMLKRDARVKLVELKTLPVAYLIGRKENDHGANVYKHGMKMTLEGAYLDLLAHLDGLETLPWQMFWAQANMDAQDYPAVRLTITVYTLSLDKNWLVV